MNMNHLSKYNSKISLKRKDTSQEHGMAGGSSAELQVHAREVRQWEEAGGGPEP